MRLIRGAPGSGKTALVFSEFKEALCAGQTDLRIVVPTSTLVRHFQHELARDGLVFSPACVTSLSRFAQERASDLKQVAGDLVRTIVRESLREIPIPEFAPVATAEGMVSTLFETILLFENAGCTPDKLAVIRKQTPQSRAFQKIWRAVYDAIRGRGFHTRADVMRGAAANLQPTRIWMDGFFNLSPIEQELVRALAQTCDLTLTLTDSAGTDALRRFALGLGAQDRLLKGNSRKPSVRVLETKTVEREADELARRILALNRHGAPFREIGIGLRDKDTYVPLLRGAFDRFGIPARFYFSHPLRLHPAAIFLNGLISCAMGGWDFESVIEALRMHPRWGRSADFDRFDFAVRQAMPGHGASALLALCERDWLRDEISALVTLELWSAGPQPAADWQHRLQNAVTAVYRPGVVEMPRDYTGLLTMRSHAAALESCFGAIEAAAAFFGPDHAISLQQFWRVASEAVRSATFSTVDDRRDVVHVMDVWEARQWDFSHLFVCGMTDRDFPKRHSRNLLFPDSEIERLRDAGIPLRKAADLDQEETSLFHSLESRARDSLFLSYPVHDTSGATVERSRFVTGEAENAPLCRPRVPLREMAEVGSVQSPALLSRMRDLHRSVSVTGLQDLAECRFKFFSRRTLGLLPPPERPRDRLQARITGLILHETLEQWQKDKNRDFVELFEQTFEKACRDHHLPPGFRLETERIRFRKIARLVSANEKWDEPESSDVELDLALELPQGIAVTCRVDRIDRFGDDCVIVDYKSSKTANVEKLTTSATRLQAPLYALAVRERLNLNPAAVVYWAVQEDELYGWGKIPGYTGELLEMPDNWPEDAHARIADRMSEFLSGDVRARPEELANCRWCDYADACRFDQREAARLVSVGAARG